MNYFKRALVSTQRKKTKSFLLLVIIFALGNVIAGSVAILKATDNVEQDIKQKLGAVIKLEVNYDQWLSPTDQRESSQPQLESLSTNSLLAIGQSSYVRNYDYSTKLNLGSGSLVVWSNPLDELNSVNTHNIFLTGVEYPQVLLIEENKAHLSSGRVFSKEEITEGAPVALITETLAELNNLNLGDHIVLRNHGAPLSTGSSVVEDWGVPLEIIGIFSFVTPIENAPKKEIGILPVENQTHNHLIVPNKIIIEEQRRMAQLYEQPEMTNEEKSLLYFTNYEAVYVLKSPDLIDDFIKENRSLIPKYYSFYTNKDLFSEISAPIQQTRKLSLLVFYLSVFSSVFISGLVVMLFLRDRKQELGLYMSLGEKKSNILLQIILEVMIVAFLAIIFSTISGYFLANSLSSSMIRDQLVVDKNYNLDEEFWQTQDHFGFFSNFVTSEDIIDNYRITFSASYIALFFVASSLTFLFSTIVPVLYIVNLKPKDILM